MSTQSCLEDLRRNEALRRQIWTEPEEGAAVRRATCTGRPCGDKRFLRRAEKLTGRCRHPPKPGRPPKGKLRNK